MIYSKFGSKLTPISKSESASGQISVQAAVEGTPEIREYPIGDLKADDGFAEINQVVEGLPRKVVELKTKPWRHG